VFFGPIIGAILMVLAFVLLSEFTKAWLLYLGLIFLFMVMFAPGGIASLILLNVRVARFGKLGRLALPYLTLAVAALPMLVGAAALIEMLYHLQLEMGLGPELHFLGLSLNVHSLSSWLGAAAALVIGGVLFAIARRRVARLWSEVNTEIAAQLAKIGAA
jgi:branched-chain amino acid transport system permease protein